MLRVADNMNIFSAVSWHRSSQSNSMQLILHLRLYINMYILYTYHIWYTYHCLSLLIFLLALQQDIQWISQSSRQWYQCLQRYISDTSLIQINVLRISTKIFVKCVMCLTFLPLPILWIFSKYICISQS